MVKDTDMLRPHIEGAAVDIRPDWDGQIRLSIAISLKRIADSLAPLAQLCNERLDTILF